MENNRISQGASYESYSIGEKKLPPEVVKKCKIDYDAEVERMKGKTHNDTKRKIHVADQPLQGYVAKAVRAFYSNLASAKNSDKLFNRAVKVAKRCFQKLESEELDDDFKNPKKRFRSAGGGRKKNFSSGSLTFVLLKGKIT